MTRIKICRVRNPLIYPLLAELEVDYVGIHLINRVDDEKLGDASFLCRKAFDSSIEPVLLTKRVEVDLLETLVRRTGAKWLQLHLEWEIANLRLLRRRLRSLGDVQLICLLNPASRPVHAYVQDILSLADFVIIDHAVGGTGIRVPDEQLSALMAVVPRDRTFLAGGLRPGNVGALVENYTPYAVDVQSGVMGSDGVQDPQLVRAFVSAVRGALPSRAMSATA